ncbi:MAG: hypothetical protein M1826_001020 [Phylliscum demangeonii]|nr:MAG: hypothetical protein M1826_001020 [Phylliscum demangeonii]
MAILATVVLVWTLRLLVMHNLPTVRVAVAALPAQQAAVSSYWLATVPRQGVVPFNPDPAGYHIYRNVRDFGAKGDGTTDDTAAINAAIQAGNRCGLGCDSSTVSPALVYFPPGTYLVSRPIVQMYLTQFVGDAVDIPTLKAAPSFVGIAVIDADPYEAWGQNWYINQNNFFRQIRNFVIDLTALPPSQGTGIHWQVAQATSLQNIRFEMVRGGGAANQQQGIFMDNGSGGFMTDLTFHGGKYGAYFGNQQFTTRNLVFDGCQTAIFMNWNWLWTFKSLSIANCEVGIDMASVGVGAVLVQDSRIAATRAGILTSYVERDAVYTNGTLVLQNVDFSGCAVAVGSPSGGTVLAGNGRVASWAQGKQYTAASSTSTVTGARVQGAQAPVSTPGVLQNAQGAIYERSRPQYEHLPAAAFLSVRTHGAKGDGRTDDTAAIQATLNLAADHEDQVVYFDHGAYVVTSTVHVPKNVRVTGEMWPLILASGAAFGDATHPVPVFQVGQAGDVGAVELSDLILATAGPAPGAILIEWNVHERSQGACGMWDVHLRIGGATGTQLQSDRCALSPSVIGPANPACEAAFMLLHVTAGASIYLENTWFWVADHELDRTDHAQISLFNGRGVLVESRGPVWMYGTSSEHSQLYQYQLARAANVYMAAIQIETPYYQANPNALSPFTPNPAFSDPDFAHCDTDACRKAWGLRVIDSTDVLIVGAGLYSFFDNYGQACLATESCQLNMVGVERSAIHLFGLSTKASTHMVTTLAAAVPQADNRDNFCSTIALFQAGA